MIEWSWRLQTFKMELMKILTCWLKICVVVKIFHGEVINLNIPIYAQLQRAYLKRSKVLANPSRVCNWCLHPSEFFNWKSVLPSNDWLLDISIFSFGEVSIAATRNEKWPNCLCMSTIQLNSFLKMLGFEWEAGNFQKWSWGRCWHVDRKFSSLWNFLRGSDHFPHSQLCSVPKSFI